MRLFSSNAIQKTLRFDQQAKTSVPDAEFTNPLLIGVLLSFTSIQLICISFRTNRISCQNSFPFSAISHFSLFGWYRIRLALKAICASCVGLSVFCSRQFRTSMARERKRRQNGHGWVSSISSWPLVKERRKRRRRRKGGSISAQNALSPPHPSSFRTHSS